jgi:predicted nucleic acid-binding protein
MDAELLVTVDRDLLAVRGEVSELRIVEPRTLREGFTAAAA